MTAAATVKNWLPFSEHIEQSFKKLKTLCFMIMQTLWYYYTLFDKTVLFFHSWHLIGFLLITFYHVSSLNHFQITNICFCHIFYSVTMLFELWFKIKGLDSSLILFSQCIFSYSNTLSCRGEKRKKAHTSHLLGHSAAQPLGTSWMSRTIRVNDKSDVVHSLGKHSLHKGRQVSKHSPALS